MAKKKILIIDDDASFGRMTKLNLEAKGKYQVVIETDAMRAEAAVKSSSPDLILLDLKMFGKAGFEVLEELKADSQTAAIPVVILTMVGGHLQKIKAVQLHGEGYIIKPATTQELVSKIERVLKKHAMLKAQVKGLGEKKPAVKRGRKKILLVDDDRDFTKIIKLNLEAGGEYQVAVENRGARVCSVASELKPDLILLDISMPDKDGFEVLKELREDSDTKLLPIVMLTGLDEEKTRRKSMALYGEGYITKPVSIEELKAKIEDVLERHREITG